jgi:uncharacterized repeat protein (TIGR02543 family)
MTNIMAATENSPLKPKSSSRTRKVLVVLGLLALAAFATVVTQSTQVQLTTSSTPAGIVSGSAYHDVGSTVSVAPPPATSNGYRFAYWKLNGVRKTDALGISINAFSFQILENSQAIAQYELESTDSDADLLPDWYEFQQYGDLSQTSDSDSDGDGVSLFAEYEKGSQPRIPDSAADGGIVEGGVSRRRGEKLAVIVGADYAHYTESSTPPGVVSRKEYLMKGTLVSTANLNGEYLGHRFTQWKINGVRQETESGIAKNQVSFTLAEDTQAVAEYIPTGQDNDADGLPDWYEMNQYGTIEYGAGSDTDEDGRNFLDEWASGTQPRIADAAGSGAIVEGGISRRRAEKLSLALDVNYVRYQESSVPAGVVARDEYKTIGTSITTANPPLEVNGYKFSQWLINGVRQENDAGIAKSSVTFSLQDETQAVAFYYPASQDADADLIPDWYEIQQYGDTLQGADSDTDDDGVDFLTEYQGGTQPRVADSAANGGIVDGGISRRRAEKMVLNLQDVTEKQMVQLNLLSSTNGIITGSGQYEIGSSATLIATPTLGYAFSGWTGDASGTVNPLSLTMDADKTVGANFGPDPSDTDLDGLTNYEEIVVHGTNPDVADTDGDGVSDGIEIQNGTNPLDPASVPTFDLTFTTSQHGSLSGAGSFSWGATATLTATPNTGYIFSGWTGDASGTDNPLSLTMNTDKIVGANFEQDLGDADGDGLSNYAEVVTHGTNPDLADTDGDGVADYREIKDGTNPNNASSFEPFSKGLVAYYSFNGTYENGARANGDALPKNQVDFVTDSSFGEVAKITGAGFVGGEGGSIEIPAPYLNQANLFTASFWIKEHGMSHWHGEAYLTSGTAEGSRHLLAHVWNSSFATANEICANNNGPDTNFNIDNSKITEVWNHYTIVEQDNVTRVFMNGQHIYSANSNGFPLGNWHIGRHWWDGGVSESTRLVASLANLRIYNRALSDADVLQLHLQESPKLMRYISFMPMTNGIINGEDEHESGTTATLTATPNPGYIFGGWTGDATGITNPLSLMMDADKTVGATFGPDLSDSDSDGLSNYDEIITHGTNPLVADTDGDGYSDGIEIQNGTNPLDPASVPTFDLTLTTPQYGSLSGAGTYPLNTNATLAATANPGYIFTKWTGDASGTENPLSLNMNADKTVGATFEQDLGDADGDGLSNYREAVVYGTNPAKADTDDDGLSDAWELGVGRFSLTVTASPLTWKQARDDARSKGGDLACFPNQEIWNTVRAGLGETALDDLQGVWIGASDAEVEGTWKWVNGLPFTFANWGSGRPNSTAGNSLDFLEISGGDGAELWKWYDRGTTSTRTRYLLEVGYSTNPLIADADADGLTDGKEQEVSTNPFLSDSDSDGLTDGEEISLVGTNPNQADSDGDSLNDANDDQDGDGLGNLAEIRTHFTNPINPDSDSDNLTDREEIELTFTNPNHADSDGDNINDADDDQDGDGLNNLVELRTHLTNPAAADSDGDALTDTEEITLVGTNPNQADSDGDSLNDANDDQDGDGLSNISEIRTHLTNPVAADGDGDGLNDGAEINEYSTNPFLSDTDGDGLTDGHEVNTTQSNPKLADSNGDGLRDGLVVALGKNPMENISAFMSALMANRTELGLHKTEDITDMRAGSMMIERAAGADKLQFRMKLQRSNDLHNWQDDGEAVFEAPMGPSPSKQFYRFGVK